MTGGLLAAAEPDPITELVPQLSAADADARLVAIQKLAEFGPSAAKAVPALTNLAKGDPDLAVRHEAILALGAIGRPAAKAVPVLVAALQEEPGLIPHAAVLALRQIGDTTVLPHLRVLAKGKELFLAVPAAGALLQLSTAPADESLAVPILLAGLGDANPAVQTDAVLDLAAAGPRVVPVLATVIKRPPSAATGPACDALGQIGPEAAAAVPQLVVLAASKENDLAISAVRALGAIGASSPGITKALSGQVRNEDAAVRMHAVFALGRTEKTGTATATILPLLQDPELSVRRAAIQALGELGPLAKDAAPALIKALRDDSGAVTIDAALALGRLGPQAVPVLTTALNDEELRSLAAMVLEEIGPAAEPAVPALVTALDDKRPEVHRAVLLAIASIGPAAKAAIPKLMTLLKDAENPLRAGAAYALIKLDAREIIPALQELLDEEDPTLQNVAAWGLLYFHPDDDARIAQGLPKIITSLASDRPLVRREAARAVVMVGPKAAPAVPALIKAINDPDPAVQSAVVSALAAVGPAAEPAVPELVRLISVAPFPQLRNGAMYALGRIGPKAAEALPALQQVAQEDDPFTRTVAIWAQLQIAPTAALRKEALPLMVAALKHPRPEARREAALTIGQIGAGNAKAVTALKEAQKDPEKSVQQAAATALGQLGGK